LAEFLDVILFGIPLLSRSALSHRLGANRALKVEDSGILKNALLFVLPSGVRLRVEGCDPAGKSFLERCIE
jgi:hypothetical protein